MLEKRLVRRSFATPPRRFPALPLSLRPPRARYGHYSDGLLALPAAVLQDLDERAAAQLGGGQAAHLDGLGFRDRAAVPGAEEEIEQALAGRGVVEDVADEGRLSGLRDEVRQPRRRGFEAVEEERVERGVARGELRGVEVPPLVVGVREGMADVAVVELPGVMHGRAVLLELG